MDLDALTKEVLGVLKDSAKDLFDREEDLEDLKEIASEMAQHRFTILTGTGADVEDARANLRTWENIARLRIAQKGLKVKAGLGYVLEKMLGIAARILAAM